VPGIAAPGCLSGMAVQEASGPSLTQTALRRPSAAQEFTAAAARIQQILCGRRRAV